AVLWRSFAPLNIGWQYAPGIAFLMALAFGLSNALRGLNRVIWAKARPSDALDLMFSTSIAVALLWMTNRIIFPYPVVPTGLFMIGGMIAFLGFVSVRYRERLVTGVATRWLALRKGGHIMGERLMIVGAGELGQFATWLIHKGTLAQAFNIIGFVDDDPRKQGLRLDGVTVLGTTADIKSLVSRHDIGIVLYAISNIRAEERVRILSTCQDLSIRTILMPNVVEMMRDEFRVGSIAANGRRTSSLLTPSQALTWLGYMEDLLQAGEYEALQLQIEHLCTEIRLGQRK
ncbi:MAG TPA: hypothetical protein PK530_03990, partial [Anaerolineales bacterium]|nr:hypothetical protein [Anaerolineales bacterium]